MTRSSRVSERRYTPFDNVSDVVGASQCIGCGVCELACSERAIRIEFDSEQGSYLPIVEQTMCVHCGRCVDVCFGATPDGHDTSSTANYLRSTLGSITGVHSGFAVDEELRFRASSGGIVTAMLGFMMDENLVDGAVVSRVEPGCPPKAKAFIAHTRGQLEGAMGSKYCPIHVNDALHEMESGKKYAFVGLPCQIYAVKKLAKRQGFAGDICMYIGLFCGGTPSYNGTKYLLYRFGMRGQSLRQIEYRGGGWPGRLQVRSDKAVIRATFTKYWPMISPWFLLDRCLTCLSGLSPDSDISAGDMWIPQVMEKDRIGTSVVISRTREGASILGAARDAGYIVVRPETPTTIFRSQKNMLDFKHRRFFLRLKVLRKLGKDHLFGRLATNESCLAHPYLWQDELLIDVGRKLAGKDRRWWLFDLYGISVSVVHKAMSAFSKLSSTSRR